MGGTLTPKMGAPVPATTANPTSGLTQPGPACPLQPLQGFPAVTFLHLLAKPPRLLTAQAGPRTDLWLGASSLTLPVHSRVQPGTEGVPFCEASPSDSPGVRPPGGWEPIRISSAVLGLCKLPVVLMKLNYN